MRLFDLSHPIETGMPVYPGDPHVSIDAVSTVSTDGANVSSLRLGSHTGTHLDAPSHVVDGGRTVDQLHLELLHGPAHILQADHQQRTMLKSQALQLADFEPLPAQLPYIVCIATGWDQHFHTPLREQHPYLSIELAQALWKRGARVLGIDTLSPDPTAVQPQTFPVHEFWLGQDGIIVENLRGLVQLPFQVNMSLLPLNIRGVDGSPVRAVAWDVLPDTPMRELK